MTDIERKAALLAMASNEESSEWTIDEAQRFMDGWLARARSERVVSVGEVVIRKEVYDFLMGQGELHGLWFGEPGTHRKPYWWREDLRALIAKAGVGEP